MNKLLTLIDLAWKRRIGINLKTGIHDYSHYIAFQKFQAEEIIRELRVRDINLNDKKVLELGSGQGGYSLVFNKNSKDFTMSDINDSVIYIQDPGSIKFEKVDVTKTFPFEDNSFDFIFSCSLVEHIDNPKKMISEAKRILKPGGSLYLSFPPFYSPVGGHTLRPFHLLGEDLGFLLTKLFKRRDMGSYKKMGLYQRTIREVKNYLKPLTLIDMWTRSFPINTAKIQLLGEFLTWHVCYLCKK